MHLKSFTPARKIPNLAGSGVAGEEGEALEKINEPPTHATVKRDSCSQTAPNLKTETRFRRAGRWINKRSRCSIEPLMV